MSEPNVAIPLSTARRLLSIAIPSDPEDKAMIEWVRGEMADTSCHIVKIRSLDMSQPIDQADLPY